MTYEAIQSSDWRTFSDRVSKLLAGRPVEIDVIGVDLGDQVEVDRLALNGITYDPDDDALYVSVQIGSERMLDHAIASPKQIWAEIDENGVSQVAILDGDGHEQILRLHETLKLPPVGS